MLNYIDNIVGINHFLIVSILIIPIIYIIFYKNFNDLNKLLYFLLVLNFITFYPYLLSTGSFDYTLHLPLHLCYITELAILISFIFKTKKIYPLLVLNSMFGGFVGFINSNLTGDSTSIEYIHYYISHFNLMLFFIIAFKSEMEISFSDLIKSIISNSFVMLLIIIFNFLFKTNYWFTYSKPVGTNLSIFFPEWPYYFILLITIGLFSYGLTFTLLLNNKVKK